MMNIVVLVILVLYLYKWKKWKKKNADLANIKNITDLILEFLLYIYFSYKWLNLNLNGYEAVAILFGMMLAIITHLITFSLPLFLGKKQNKMTAKLMIIEIFYIWLFFAFGNLAIYAWNNAAFVFSGNEVWYEKMFDFLYYVFCNAVTYGACGIAPANIVAKITQMLNIAIFYFLILNWLSNLISKKVDYKE